MSFKIKISLRAKKDIDISCDWYEKAVTGLGIRFVLTIDEELGVISLSRRLLFNMKMVTDKSQSITFHLL